jgi:hypothetical protein
VMVVLSDEARTARLQALANSFKINNKLRWSGLECQLRLTIWSEVAGDVG